MGPLADSLSPPQVDKLVDKPGAGAASACPASAAVELHKKQAVRPQHLEYCLFIQYNALPPDLR